MPRRNEPDDGGRRERAPAGNGAGQKAAERQKDPCNGADLHKNVEHNIAEKVAEAIFPNVTTKHEMDLKAACDAQRALDEMRRSRGESGGGAKGDEGGAKGGGGGDGGGGSKGGGGGEVGWSGSKGHHGGNA
jgi:uncharacterized membrane protein YgcG